MPRGGKVGKGGGWQKSMKKRMKRRMGREIYKVWKLAGKGTREMCTSFFLSFCEKRVKDVI